MISQRCPRCGSKRIRRGYRPTPIWLKILFRYNLLCDSCNWEFTGFAVPGTVSTKSAKKQKRSRNVEEDKPDAVEDKSAEIIEKTELTDLPPIISTEEVPAASTEKKKRKKRAKVKL